jgi:hypothetical protein
MRANCRWLGDLKPPQAYSHAAHEDGVSAVNKKKRAAFWAARGKELFNLLFLEGYLPCEGVTLIRRPLLVPSTMGRRPSHLLIAASVS